MKETNLPSLCTFPLARLHVAEKMSAFPAMGIVIVDVATVKDAAKHTAVFVVNLNFSFSLFSFVLKLLLLLDDEEVDDGFVLFFSSSIVRQQ